MASNNEGKKPVSDTESSSVTQAMFHQAEAAAYGQRDPTAKTPAQRRNEGRDTTIADAGPGDAATLAAEQQIPQQPVIGDQFGRIEQELNGFGTRASVTEDGRVNIRISQKNRQLSSLLVPALKHQQRVADDERSPPPPYVPPSLGGAKGVPPPPPMNVVIHVVGSRGDVQPFVALGKVLRETYHHRVRIATHPVFKDFINENELEFFSIGADPAALMAFMVKNPGLMPGFDSLRDGDVGKRRREVAEYLKGCWRSCFETGDGLGPEISDDNIDDIVAHLPDEGSYLHRPFVADCIIANPPSFAHIHCAEKLGIPLHIMFTMPYSPTQAFPHPLANIQSSNAEDNLTNYVSYALIEMLTWQGLGDVINRFRNKSLGLEPISLMWAPGLLQRAKVPYTYCWSPALIPKPKDWGSLISISGFFFLDLATNYAPDPELQAFLDAGPPPVYIGFGSIVLDDPNAMTELIFEAVRRTGQRALVSKGWGGMGADALGKPDDVFMLGNVPHDWLFNHVSCVVHHGGAGTTATGIRLGKPTVVVPFFGDQPFWGAMVARAGAGPTPIPHKQLTAENLADAIMTCLEPSSQEKAHELAAKIARERGSDTAAQKFHQFLDVDGLRCSLDPSRAAVWRIKRTQVRLSALAACTLANEGLLDFNDIKLFRPREYETEDAPWDPITGVTSALLGTIGAMMMGVADFPIDTLKALKIHPDSHKPADSGAEGTASSSHSSHDAVSSRTRSSSNTGASTPAGSATPRTQSDTNSGFNLSESLSQIGASSPPGTSQDRTLNRMSSSMADALRGQLGSSSPGSRSRSGSVNRPRSRSGSFSVAQDRLQTSIDTGKGVYRIANAGLKAPMDVTLGLARGFHNAPRLYGDDTVRKPDQVTDLKSGLIAAGKGFGLGLYDGITGLVTQPIQGAQKEGPVGFVKGIGKGIGGIVLKPSAAAFAIPAYTMKGVYKEMKRNFGPSVTNYIIASRTAQGFEEWQHSSPSEREDIVSRWTQVQAHLKKKRNPDEMMRDVLEQQMRRKEEWVEAKKAVWVERHRSRSRAASTSTFRRSVDAPIHDSESQRLAAEALPAHDSAHRRATTTLHPANDEARALDEAIRRSVQDSSTGDADDDAQLAEGIRASLAENLHRVRSSRADRHEEDELQRALAASAAQPVPASPDPDLERALAASSAPPTASSSSHDPDYDRALAASLRDRPPATSPPHPPAYSEHDDAKPSPFPPLEKSQAELTEEQIVLEYVMKQSRMEEDFRLKRQVAAPPSYLSVDAQGSVARLPHDADEHDEELQRALKASLREGRQE